MKSIKLVPLVLFAAACGQNDRVFQTRTVVEVAKPCTVDQLQDGASISCPDGTSAVVSNGQQGAPGPAARRVRADQVDPALGEPSFR